MEELRSTEILDKEIYADARKKAERILSKADVDSKLILADVENRLKTAEKELSEKFGAEEDLAKKKCEAALPLEKERFLVKFIQDSLSGEIDSYIKSLSEEDRLLLVLKNSDAAENLFKSKKIDVYYYGFDEKTVKKILDKKFDVNSFEKTEFNKLIAENDCGLSFREGVILESCDKTARCRFTVSELVSQILYKYRKELTDSLFGGRL